MSDWQVDLDEAHRLVLHKDGTAVLVHAACCFPWSYPSEYISLRNDKGVEQVFIPRPADLAADQRAILEAALKTRNFIPEILAIQAIAEDRELYRWSVTTQAGPRKFLTERRNHLRQLLGGAVLIRDVAGDMLLVPAPAKLDAQSYALIRNQMD